MTRMSDSDQSGNPPSPTLGGFFFQSLRVGLLGGLVWGWLQALKLSRPAIPYMDLRQWADVLSYSGLAQGLIWMLHGAFFGVLCTLPLLVLRPLRRAVRPGALALGFFMAGTVTFQVWIITAEHMPRAVGIQSSWVMGMATCWGLLFASVYGLSHIMAPKRPGRLLATLSRWAFWPAVLVLVVSAFVQWFERPQILPATADWEESAGAPASPPEDRPNIVLVVLDTQRLDRLGCYGYERPTTPRLDRFAGDAMVYDNYISTAVWTLPSHASMFTGFFPSEHGSSWDHIWLDGRFTTMAEILGEMDYQTFGLSNNIVVSPHTNLTQGFERFAMPQTIATARGNYLDKFLHRILYPAGWVGKWLGKLTEQDQGAKYTNQIAARWLADRDQERPFFLFVNYLEPHDPFRPTFPYRKLFVESGDMRASFRHNWDKVAEYAVLKRDLYSEKDLQVLSDTYDAETRLTDDYLGQFLEVLAAETDLDRTLVMITSDHGENLGDHHLLLHAWCVYDTLVHLPLIVRYPSRLKPGRHTEITQTVDLLPTVLDAVHGQPVAGSGLGRSLFSPPAEEQLQDDPALAELTGRPAIMEYTAPSRAHVNTAQKQHLRSDRTPFESEIYGIRQGPWKYITYEDGRRELFNVVVDKDELNNLIEIHPAIAGQLAETLHSWRSKLTPYEPHDGDDGHGETDEATINRLRELGYMQ